jgi:hypothetical protein
MEVPQHRSAGAALPASLMRSACLAEPLVPCFTRRTAAYGPVCTVVWKGWASNRSPYPDLPGDVPNHFKAVVFIAAEE